MKTTQSRRLPRILFTALAAVALLGSSAFAAGRPRIGLALSGGGARGAAHIGVLRVLEERRVPVDCIAGTSMGAIVGGLYAAGMTPDELETLIGEIDWADAFDDDIPRRDRSFRRKQDDDLFLVDYRPGIGRGGLALPPGLLDGQKIDLLLERHASRAATVADFDSLGIPFRAVATDIVTGETVVLSGGDLATAIRASMSLPVIFAPREIDGRLLVDGGVSCNLAIDVVRRMGADIVIAVDISTPLQKRDELRSLVAVTDQLTGILTRRNTDIQIGTLAPRDIFIRPELGDIATGSFGRAAEAVPAGVAAAEAAGDRLAALSLPAGEWRRYLAARQRPHSDLVVDGVRILNDSHLADGVITRRIDIEAGAPLDVDRLEHDIDRLYGLELFESVSWDLARESEGNVLNVTAREAPRGPNYLQLGAAVFEDYESPNFNVAVAWTRMALNRLGGELRAGAQFGQEPGLFAEWHQPLDQGLRWFVHLRSSIGERATSVFDGDGSRVMELALRRGGGQIALGRELGAWGEVRAGLLRDGGSVSMQTGDPTAMADGVFDTGEAFVRLFIDELDSVTFPRSGHLLRVRAAAAREALGADTAYEQVEAEGSLAVTRGRLTAFLRGWAATTPGDDAPFQRAVRLGGFSRLSGLEHNELAGQHAGLASCALFARIGSLGIVPVYGGCSLEYGEVFARSEDIRIEDGRVAGSVFLGLDTPIGPLYAAWGLVDGGRANGYLFLGQSLARPVAGLWDFR
ncbi:MAG: patatin-like phospholipase family protein [Candidatus Krumholzibacteriota bacterium]|nr:patatin-like phospholipase family protein [Candidatus Krumholzibacteriota bacterium]